MNEFFREPVKWTYRELIQALVLTFVVVPIFIEGVLKSALSQWFGNELYAGTLTGLVMAIVFLGGVYYIALRPFGYQWRDVGVRRFSVNYWKWIVMWTIVYIIASILLLILMDFFQAGVANKKSESLKENVTWLTFLTGFLSAAVISPVYEEIFYRGFLYKWFRLKWGVGAGLVLSSVIFMLVHIPTYNTLPVTFIGGLLFAWAYEKSGSVVPSMIIHGTFNGIAVFATAFA